MSNPNNVVNVQETASQIKQRIIKRFMDYVKGKLPDTSLSHVGHDGKGGHWLEKQMGITHNANNDADIDGFEMKNETTSKTTFGDWSANYYIYKNDIYFKKEKSVTISRDKFMEIFGGANLDKDNRYSWSGKPVPKIGNYNSFGQKLLVDKNGDIYAKYSYVMDTRQDKSTIVPLNMQKDDLVLARWDVDTMKRRVEKKFNKLGWFKCEKDKETGIYTQISFGGPLNFITWIAGVKKGLIYFDSGMHVGNKRPYSSWRADNKYWNSLIIDRY